MKNFIWHSTEESVQKNKISITAIIEIPFAVFLYLYLVPTFLGYWTPVIISTIAAPLLLLRSQSSIRKAITIWGRDIDRDAYAKQGKYKGANIWQSVLIIITYLFTPVIVTWYLAETWLASDDGSNLVFLAVLTGLISVVLTIAAIAVTDPYGGVLVLLTVLSWSSTLSFVGTVPIIVIKIGLTAGLGALLGLILGLFLLPLGLAIGLLVRSIFIRIISVLVELPEGLVEIRSNWRRTMFCEDLFQLPKIIPGSHKLDLSLRKKMYYFDGIEFAVIFSYPIAVVWRLALKSTFWLYGPIMFIVHPGHMNSNESRKKWLTRNKTAWEKLIFWIGLLVFAFSILTLVDYGKFPELWRDSKDFGVPFDLITWSLAVDYNIFMSQPWRWFSLLNLVCALVVFLWRDAIAKQLINKELVAMRGWPVGWLVRLARAQIIFFIGYWLLSISYFVPFMINSGRAPEWLVTIWYLYT